MNKSPVMKWKRCQVSKSRMVRFNALFAPSFKEKIYKVVLPVSDFFYLFLKPNKDQHAGFARKEDLKRHYQQHLNVVIFCSFRFWSVSVCALSLQRMQLQMRPDGSYEESSEKVSRWKIKQLRKSFLIFQNRRFAKKNYTCYYLFIQNSTK